MDALAEKLDTRLRVWNPKIRKEVRQIVSEVIELADEDALDVIRSRVVEQEVLDMLDQPTS